jgi:hypothetical protein
VTRPEEEKILSILEKMGMKKEDLKCSICESNLELKDVRAIFPYHSALICCNKPECLIACRDKLIETATDR